MRSALVVFAASVSVLPASGGTLPPGGPQIGLAAQHAQSGKGMGEQLRRAIGRAVVDHDDLGPFRQTQQRRHGAHGLRAPVAGEHDHAGQGIQDTVLSIPEDTPHRTTATPDIVSSTCRKRSRARRIRRTSKA